MDAERYAAVTRRCIEDDLGLQVPDPEALQRARLDHPLIVELCRIAPDTPKGQKAVAQLHERKIRGYAIKHSTYRGCTVHLSYPQTEIFQAVWLVAAGERKADSPDQDAYSYFDGLADEDLTPTEADWIAVAVERIIWFVIPTAIEEAVESAKEALAAPGSIVAHDSPVSNVKVVAQVLVDEETDEQITELIVAFYHVQAATDQGNLDVHALILEGIASELGFSADLWEETWSQEFPQTAKSIYAALY